MSSKYDFHCIFWLVKLSYYLMKKIKINKYKKSITVKV